MIAHALIVGCGGFIGALLRYLCSQFLSGISTGAFPLATFVVNLVGSFLIGVMSVLLPAAFPNSRLICFDWHSRGIYHFFYVQP